MKELWRRIIAESRLLKKYIVYFVLILLPFIINLIGFSSVTEALKHQIQKNNVNLLENIGVMGDEYLEQIRTKTFSLLTSDQTKRLQRTYTQLEQTDMVSDMEGLINSFFESNEFTVTVLVKNKNLCVQNNLGACTMELAYESTFKDVYESYDQWINSVFSEPGADFKVLKTNSGQNKIYLIYYVPSLVRDAAVITELDSKAMKQLLSVSGEDCIYIMTNGSGEPLIVPYDSQVEMPRELDISGSQTRINGVEYWQCSVKSGIADWNYVNLIPSHIYLDSVRSVWRTLLIGYFMLVAGFAITAFLFRKSSRRKEKQLAVANSKYESYRKENLLKHLITGKASDTDRSYLKQRMFTEGESYCVILFDIHHDNDELLSDNICLDEIAGWIKSKTEKLTENHVTLSCITVDGMLIGIAEFEDEAYEIESALKKLCKLSRDAINVDIYCTVSIAFNCGGWSISDYTENEWVYIDSIWIQPTTLQFDKVATPGGADDFELASFNTSNTSNFTVSGNIKQYPTITNHREGGNEMYRLFMTRAFVTQTGNKPSSILSTDINTNGYQYLNMWVYSPFPQCFGKRHNYLSGK